MLTVLHKAESYKRNPDSGAKSTARSKNYYHEDIDKSQAEVLHEANPFITKISIRVVLTVQSDQRQITNMILWQVKLIKDKGMYYHVCVHF